MYGFLTYKRRYLFFYLRKQTGLCKSRVIFFSEMNGLARELRPAELGAIFFWANNI